MELQETARDPDLQERIRELLLNYAFEHMCIDHVAYTGVVVPEFVLENVQPVPLFDPGSIQLPVDPFKALLKPEELSAARLGLNIDAAWKLPPPVLPPQVYQCIKTALSSSRTLKSERVILDKEMECYPPLRSLSPPLVTRAATRTTPNLDKTATLDRVSLSRGRFLLDHLKPLDLRPLATLPIGDEQPVNLEEALSLQIEIHEADRESLRDLLHTVPAAQKTHASPRTRKLPSAVLSLLAEVDEPCVNPPNHRLSPPLFPRRSAHDIDFSSSRDRSMNPKRQKINPNEMEDLIGTIKLEESALSENLLTNDFAKESMSVIDRWYAVRPSSPPLETSHPPSLSHGSDTTPEPDIDEILWVETPSPPKSKKRSKKTVAATRFDDFEIARVDRIGSKNPSFLRLDPVGEQLSSHLAHVLLPVPITPLRKPAKEERCLSPSILGQPPTTIEGELEEKEETSTNGLEDVDAVLERLCRPVRGQDAASWVMQERMDKDSALLLDVPTLRPPNIHIPSGPSPPHNMAALLAPTRSKTKKGKQKNSQLDAPNMANAVRLAKIPGLASLNIDLSWRPFVSGESIPTHEELAGVGQALHSDKDGMVHNSIDPIMVSALLQSSDTKDSPDTLDRTLFALIAKTEADEEASIPNSGFKGEGDPIMNKADRQRLGSSRNRGAQNFNDEIEDYIESPHSDSLDDVQMLSPAPIPMTPLHASPSMISRQPHELIRSDSHDLEGPTRTLVSRNQTGSLRRNRQTFSALSSDDGLQNGSGRPDIPSRDPSFEDLEMPPRKMMRFTEEEDVERDQDTHQEDQQNLTPPTLSERRTTLPTLDIGDYQFDHRPIKHSRQLRSQQAILTPKPPPIGRPEVPAQARYGIAIHEFRRLRNMLIDLSPPPMELLRVEPPPQVDPELLPQTRGIPPGVLDPRAICLPEIWHLPTRLHRYMVSMDLVKKRVVAATLTSRDICAVDLVERDSLEHSVDVILDSHTAVIFFALGVLPGRVDDLLQQLQSASWSYTRLVVLFETYPSSEARFVRRGAEQDGVILAFSPPVLAALKKIKRNVGIARGMEALRPSCSVEWVFAVTPDEAARFIRALGDQTEGGSGSALWDDRQWLADEEIEDEVDFAMLPDMNRFAAVTILSRISGTEFLSLSPNLRSTHFGPLVGQERIEMVNRVLVERGLALDSPTPSQATSSRHLTEDSGYISYDGGQNLEVRGEEQYDHCP